MSQGSHNGFIGQCVHQLVSLIIFLFMILIFKQYLFMENPRLPAIEQGTQTEILNENKMTQINELPTQSEVMQTEPLFDDYEKQVQCDDLSKINKDRMKHQIFTMIKSIKRTFDIKNMFDEAGDKDFTNECGSKNIGGQKYIKPCGWIRIGLNVKGIYGDDSWLEPSEKNSNLWVRGYHDIGGDASGSSNAFAIFSEIYKSGGLRICKRNLYCGVYWSNDPNYADGLYTGYGTANGYNYAVKLMVAVNPNGLVDNSKGFLPCPTKRSFRCPNPKDIRVYGLLIKEI